MKIVHYHPQYRDDVEGLILQFHEKFLKEFDKEIYGPSVDKTIAGFEGENARNSFLLLDGDKCVGLLAGIEIQSCINDKRIFSEIFWYLEESYGMFILWFIEEIEKMLKEQGYSIIVMAILNSVKAEKIKKIYELTGYKHLETHYMKNL